MSSRSRVVRIVEGTLPRAAVPACAALLSFLWLAGAAAGCGGAGLRVQPPPPAPPRDSVWIGVDRAMAVGDTVLAGVWQRRCHTCPIDELPVDGFEWSTPDSNRIALGRTTIGRGRREAARITVAGLAPGLAVLSARRGSEWREVVVTVLPPVASVRWEPREVTLAPGASTVLRAVAWDSAGRPVAIIRWSSAWTRPDEAWASVSQEPIGDLLMVRGEKPGTRCIVATLGHRSDTARVVVRSTAADTVSAPGCGRSAARSAP